MDINRQMISGHKKEGEENEKEKNQLSSYLS